MRFLAPAALAVMLGFARVPAYALDVPPNDGYVTDASNVQPALISPAQDAALEAKLSDYEARTTNQIAVLVVRSLEDEVLEEYAVKAFRQYGIGTKKNNGILILVSYDDRAVRLEVGYGLEGAVPDIVASGIIETDMIPKFRDGDYAGAIDAAIDALEKHIANEYTADRYTKPAEDGAGIGSFGFFFGFVVLQWLLSILARTRSWWLGGVFGFIGGAILAFLYGWWLSIPFLVVLGFLLDFVVSRNYRARGPTSWWAGGGWGPGGGGRWGGGGGGGFGGFGGGSTGGGGASGRW